MPWLQANPCVVGAKVAALLLERLLRTRHIAFAMGLHPRLGGEGGCRVPMLGADAVRLVLEVVDRG